MALSILATAGRYAPRAAFLIAATAIPVAAQQQAPAPPQPQLAAPQQQPQQQQFQQSQEWSKLPKMQLERQFAGPLQDTVVQRLRDPVDGTVCYLYLPISVVHSPTTATGFVQYGANGVGSISCTQGAPLTTGSTTRPAAPLTRRRR
jgi:hypothetical protein